MDPWCILLRLVTDLQTHKQAFSIFVHKNRDFGASNSLIWRFYEARLYILFPTMV